MTDSCDQINRNILSQINKSTSKSDVKQTSDQKVYASTNQKVKLKCASCSKVEFISKNHNNSENWNKSSTIQLGALKKALNDALSINDQVIFNEKNSKNGLKYVFDQLKSYIYAMLLDDSKLIPYFIIVTTEKFIYYLQLNEKISELEALLSAAYDDIEAKDEVIKELYNIKKNESYECNNCKNE